MDRRGFLSLAAAASAGAIGLEPRASTAETAAVTGVADANLAPFDRLMESFVAEQHVPGAALAVTRAGRLVYARGFGYGDVERKDAVQPNSLFRIASVSKPLTAVAILRLVERGKLRLQDRVWDRLRLTSWARTAAPVDKRWRDITVQQCLQHTGGWDRGRSGDPIGRPVQIARALNVPVPPRPVHIVRYMLGQPLDFDPGTRYAYSNLGYLVLGRVLEAVTGQKYESFVRQEVLAPLGIRAARLGRALPEYRAKDEVRYYDSHKRMGACLYPPRRGQSVPLPDGAENLEGFEAHGGWIASAVQLVRFAAAFDNPARSPLLRAETIHQMRLRPDGPPGLESDGKPKPAYYACGWMVRPVGATGKSNDWHAGFIAGSEALLVRRWDGLNWAVVFNTAENPAGKHLADLIDPLLHQAADRVRRWPQEDQFGRYLT